MIWKYDNLRIRVYKALGELMRKKIVFGILTVLAVVGIMLLTFQGPEDTMKLSEGARGFLARLGFLVESHALRSNIHLLEYFIAGLVFTLFNEAMGWKRWLPVLLGCAFGLMDELIKIPLPTREFDAVDLVKDWIGVSVAFALVQLCIFLRGRRSKNH